MMNFLRVLVFAAALFASPAFAATCFWVGGTGTWSTSNTASWSSSSGGAGGTCAGTGGVPKQAADTATFDGSSGAGTVTVDSTMNGVTLTSIAAGAFTGTLDFSANNPSMTLTFSFVASGAGVHTINLGSGTFTFTSTTGGLWDAGTSSGNLTLSAGSSTIVYSSNANGARAFNGGGKTYGTLTISTPGSFTTNPAVTVSGNNTFATLNVNPSVWIRLGSGSTTTITNAFNWTGTSSSAAIMLDGGTGGTTTISSANNGTITWGVVSGVAFTGGGTFTCTSCLDMKANSGITITAPSGGGGRIIGG